MPPIVVCAEDYGIAHGVCDAALDLVAMGRISAVAACPGGVVFATRAAELAALPRTIGVGLSLDLARGRPAAFAARALAGRLDRDGLAAAIARDLDAFSTAVGRLPDFVGSPGEVHTLPGVRAALFRALAGEELAGRLWLRDPSERLATRLRRGTGLLAASAAHGLASGFARAARARGYATNRGYAGFPPRSPGAPAPATYERLAQRPGPEPLLVVRPAYGDATLEAADRRADFRKRELFYLSSERFADLMEVLDWRLVPAPGAQSP